MITEQFRLEQFKLEHPHPEDFSTCCWQRSRKVTAAWLAYRVVTAAYFQATLLYVLISWYLQEDLHEGDKPKNLIFLTYWTYVLECHVFFLGLFTSVRDFMKQRNHLPDKKTSAVAKAYWVLYTVALPSAVMVTAAFWIGVYDPELFPINGPNVILHINNSVFLVVDFLLVAVPFRFLHFYMPNIYMTVYIIFSVIYELSGGTGVKGQRPIYKIVDWEMEPSKTAGYVCVCALGALGAHAIFSVISLIKFWLRKEYLLNKTCSR